MTRTILVTGASGLLGREVVQLLAERGHRIHTFGRSSEPGQDEGIAEHHTGDLTTGLGLNEAVRRAQADWVVHLAWDTRPPLYESSAANVDLLAATLHLARACTSIGCQRFLGAGTCAEYDWSVEVHDELETVCRPGTLYGAAKHAAFVVLETYFRGEDASFAWPRYTFLFGENDTSGRLIGAAIDALRAGEDFVCGSPSLVRDFIHAKQAASATVALLESDVTGPVNIGSGTPMSIGEVLEIIERLVHGSGRVIRSPGGTGGQPRRLSPRLDRLAEEVGWTPSESLESSLERTVRLRPRHR